MEKGIAVLDRVLAELHVEKKFFDLGWFFRGVFDHLKIRGLIAHLASPSL